MDYYEAHHHGKYVHTYSPFERVTCASKADFVSEILSHVNHRMMNVIGNRPNKITRKNSFSFIILCFSSILFILGEAYMFVSK